MEGANQIRISKQASIRDLFVVITAGIGLFLSTLDTGIINVAMPTLVTVFHSTVSGIAWTVTLYTLVLTGTIVIFGRLSDRYGHLKMYTWGLLVFAVSSTLCGLSQTTAELIISRTVQGIGAAMLQATSAAIITTIIQRDRQGPALGSLGILMGLGPVLGPSVGGTLISFAGGRSIFWINIPVVVTGLIGCGRLKKAVNEVLKPVHLNVTGNLLLSISILALLESLSVWSTTGRSNFVTIGLLVVCGLLLTVFGVRELCIAHPIIDLRLFCKSDFTASVLAAFFFGGATSLGFIIPPYFSGQFHFCIFCT